MVPSDLQPTAKRSRSNLVFPWQRFDALRSKTSAFARGRCSSALNLKKETLPIYNALYYNEKL
jgi:hypothetical protein